jgi:predicted nuclease of restriction endonuclease-like (RecB) superfamily
MGIAEHWSVRQLRDKQDEMAYERSLIAVKPEDEIVKTLEKVTPTYMEPDVVLRNSYGGITVLLILFPKQMVRTKAL